jgi:lipopolysaccharide transport system ATP-binding protein
MSDAVITVENLSKCYMVGRNAARDERNPTLRDAVVRGASGFARKTRDIARGKPIIQGQRLEEFWALTDVSFEVNAGDTLGIIGRNGAGKSTLLKVLSRITEPTKGRITIQGRVASLLEVGTGFHPELTGRQNIYLNGAILGMTRSEIKRKFDEIVAFAEVDTFLDTPVKRYSSGMYVRLAFAVAAHLEPEILIVDEVLAVGDAAFQKKCLGKMGAVASEGRTVLFVSHNMGMISQLCSSCMLLEKGIAGPKGNTAATVDSYLRSGAESASGERTFPEDESKQAQLLSVSVQDSEGIRTDMFTCDAPVSLRMEIAIRQNIPGLYGYLQVDRADGTRVLVSDSFDADQPNPLDGLDVGTHSFLVTIPARTLGHGDYTVTFSLACPLADQINVDAPGVICAFSLNDVTSKRGNQRAGFFSTLLDWREVGPPAGDGE